MIHKKTYVPLGNIYEHLRATTPIVFPIIVILSLEKSAFPQMFSCII